jgi:hypothetical protein
MILEREGDREEAPGLCLGLHTAGRLALSKIKMTINFNVI